RSRVRAFARSRVLAFNPSPIRGRASCDETSRECVIDRRKPRRRRRTRERENARTNARTRERLRLRPQAPHVVGVDERTGATGELAAGSLDDEAELLVQVDG